MHSQLLCFLFAHFHWVGKGKILTEEKCTNFWSLGVGKDGHWVGNPVSLLAETLIQAFLNDLFHCCLLVTALNSSAQNRARYQRGGYMSPSVIPCRLR